MDKSQLRCQECGSELEWVEVEIEHDFGCDEELMCLNCTEEEE